VDYTAGGGGLGRLLHHNPNEGSLRERLARTAGVTGAHAPDAKGVPEGHQAHTFDEGQAGVGTLQCAHQTRNVLHTCVACTCCVLESAHAYIVRTCTHSCKCARHLIPRHRDRPCTRSKQASHMSAPHNDQPGRAKAASSSRTGHTRRGSYSSKVSQPSTPAAVHEHLKLPLLSYST